MKVVLNKCYGGFSLSPEGERAYLARQGKEAFFYVEDRDQAISMIEQVEDDTAGDNMAM